jgi:hypothetical protein
MSRARRSRPADRPGRARLRVLLATTLAVTAWTAEPAVAAPFSFTFDWAGSPATGFFGWQRTDQLPAPGASPPFLPPYYASVRSGAGPGIRLRPSPAADGTRDRIYSNYDPSTQSGGPKINEIYIAPGTTTIARARIRDVSFLNDSEGQILRAAIIDQAGAFAAESAYGMDDGSPPPGPFLPGVSYSNVVLPELFWPGYATGIPSRLELSLRTICVPAGNCPLVHFQADGTPMSSGRFGTVELDLIDPEAPSLNLGGSLTTSSSWVNTNRSGRLTFTAQDPGSGVRKLRLERRGSSATTVLLNETIACDLTHSSPPSGTLPGGACPAQADRSVSQSVSTNGVTTFVATATDLSGETTTRQAQIRVDRQRPTAALNGAVRALAGRWTNRTDAVGATVAGHDALSGVSKLQIADSAAGSVGEAAVCTTGSGPSSRCAPAGAARLDVALAALRDGRRTLRPVATDLAGNRSATAPGVTLLLDRRSPGVPRNVRLTRTPSGARGSFSRASADSGSPIATSEVRSAVGASAFGPWRRTGTSFATGGRASDSLHAEVRGVDAAGNRSRAVRVDLAARARSSTGRPACRAGRACTRAPQRSRRPRRLFGQVVEAAATKKPACGFKVKGFPGERIDARPIDFQAKNTRVGVRVQFGNPRAGICRDGEVILNMTGRAKVDAQLTPRLEKPLIDRVLTYVPGRNNQELTFPCEEDLDGGQNYVVSFPGGFSGLAQAVSKRKPPEPLAPRPENENQSFYFSLQCPSTTTRQKRERDAWRYLAGYDPVAKFDSTTTSVPGRVGYGRTVLRRALAGEVPSGPSLAWQAHHIIPLRDLTDNGLVVVAAAFRCHVYPNLRENGVYLRAPAYRKGTKEFFEIPDLQDRLRTWHPFTTGRHLESYFAHLRRELVSADAIGERKGTCRHRRVFETVLARVKLQLASDSFFLPGRPEPGP